MKLTAKQEAFCQAMATGRMTQADAYRSAYSAEGMKPKSVQERACVLAKHSKVAARIASLKQEVASKALWTREQSIEVLAGVIAELDAKGHEKIAAVKELNTMHGFIAPTRHEIDLRVNVNVNFD